MLADFFAAAVDLPLAGFGGVLERTESLSGIPASSSLRSFSGSFRAGFFAPLALAVGFDLSVVCVNFFAGAFAFEAGAAFFAVAAFALAFCFAVSKKRAGVPGEAKLKRLLEQVIVLQAPVQA